MCIAAISKKGGFNATLLKSFFISNPHGGSFTYAENGELVTDKNIVLMDEYVRKGLALKDKENLMTHCRWATQGPKNLTNAHPFMLNGNKAALIHNGNIFQADNKDYSDTKEFSLMADVLGRKDLLTDQVIKRVSALIGAHNKLLVLHATGEFDIYNEDAGYWQDDNNMWVSNLMYKADYERKGYFSRYH